MTTNTKIKLHHIDHEKIENGQSLYGGMLYDAGWNLLGVAPFIEREFPVIEWTLFTWEDYQSGIRNYGEKMRILEQEWRRSTPVLSDGELLRVFPEAIEVVETKLREERQIFIEQVLVLKERITEDRTQDEFTHWFLCELRKHFIGPALEQAWRRMQSYRRQLAIAHGNDQQGISIKPEDITAAKMIPIESLLEIKRSSRIHAYVNCPFHDDRIPSFVIYKEQNTFHCFGCGAHGDVIDFVMRRDDLSFREAVKSLIGR